LSTISLALGFADLALLSSIAALMLVLTVFMVFSAYPLVEGCPGGDMIFLMLLVIMNSLNLSAINAGAPSDTRLPPNQTLVGWSRSLVDVFYSFRGLFQTFFGYLMAQISYFILKKLAFWLFQLVSISHHLIV
jgi:hypothetical protein